MPNAPSKGGPKPVRFPKPRREGGVYSISDAVGEGRWPGPRRGVSLVGGYATWRRQCAYAKHAGPIPG